MPRYPIEDRTQIHPKTTWQHYPQPGDPNPVVGVSVVQVEGVSGARTRRDRVFSGGNAEYLPRFGWTPDSRAVWYELLDRPQRRLEMVREDVATGTAATLFVERDAAWINLHDEQRFLSDGRLLWSSEAGGYRHLVMYARGRKRRAPVTSGRLGGHLGRCGGRGGRMDLLHRHRGLSARAPALPRAAGRHAGSPA